MGEASGWDEPGPGEPRAGPGRPGAAPTTKWQQGFDAALTDVFQVQADIAGQVAQALERGPGGQRQTRAGGEADPEPARLRCLPAGRGRVAGDERTRTRRVFAKRLPRTSRPWRWILPLPWRGRNSPGRRQRCTALAGSLRQGPRRRAMRPSGRWRWLPPAPRVTRPWRRITAMCPRETTPARTPKTAPRSPWLPAMPSCSELWGSTNSTSAAGRQRAGTWSRLPGSIPAQARPPISSGSCCSTPAITPRPSGPSITRSSSCRRTCWCARIGRRWRWRRATSPARGP